MDRPEKCFPPHCSRPVPARGGRTFRKGGAGRGDKSTVASGSRAPARSERVRDMRMGLAEIHWRAPAVMLHFVTLQPRLILNEREPAMSESMPDLGDLEREVMQLIWANGRLTAETGREKLARRLKESTVRTVLRRLEEKGYVVHAVSRPTHPHLATP